MTFRTLIFSLAVVTCLAVASAQALTVPFTEDFESGDAGWRDVVSAPVTLNATGGADGGQYVSTITDFSGSGGQTLFRCHDTFGCSGGAFEGDWATNVGTFSWDIRHNASTDLTFFARLAGVNNFPAWTGELAVNVAPNTWTTLTLPIDESHLQPEGGTFEGVLGSIAKFQIGVDNEGISGTGVQFDLDRVSLSPVPEPSTLLLGFLSSCFVLRRNRHHRNTK